MAVQVSTQRTTRSTGWAMVGVILTLLATLFVPFGGLVVGLSIAYVVYADDEAMKRRFCMLAGVATIVWAVLVVGFTGVSASGVTGEVGPVTVAHAPATAGP